MTEVGGTRTLAFVVNGEAREATVEDRVSLADCLRDFMGLTGTHLGCEHGVCGACTVLLDGVPVRSCITLAVSCAGRGVVTVEGLEGSITDALRESFSAEHGLQCGFCTPGMLVTCLDLLARSDDLEEGDVRLALGGNLCRCTGYEGIVRAVLAAQRRLNAAGHREAGTAATA